MNRWVHRHFGILATAVTIAIIVLVVMNAWKYGWLTTKLLVDNKELIDTVGKLLTAVLLVAGVVFSYFRFFYGRTLSRRADVTIDPTAIAAHDGTLLHAIRVSVKNVGTVTIWHPKPELELRVHLNNDECTLHRLKEAIRPQAENAAPSAFTLIEPGETVPYFFQHRVAANAWAVTIIASVGCDSGDVWQAFASVPNKGKAPSNDKP